MFSYAIRALLVQYSTLYVACPCTFMMTRLMHKTACAVAEKGVVDVLTC